MNTIKDLFLSDMRCSGFSELISSKLKIALSDNNLTNRSGKFRYLLTFPNKKEIPKKEFADQIFSIISKLNIEHPPKEDNKWKSWFYLVEESYKTEGKHIHVFVWLTYPSTKWDSIKSRFTFEIDKTVCSPYVLPIGTTNWTAVLLYLTKEDNNPIYSVERQEDIIKYFNALKEKSFETEELRVNLSNVVNNMIRHQESTLVKSYFKREEGLSSEEEETFEEEEEEETIRSVKSIETQNEDAVHKVLQLKTKIFESKLVVIQTKSDKAISFVLDILKNNFKLQKDENYRVVEISPHHPKVENQFDKNFKLLTNTDVMKPDIQINLNGGDVVNNYYGLEKKELYNLKKEIREELREELIVELTTKITNEVTAKITNEVKLNLLAEVKADIWKDLSSRFILNK